jgi:hypothetical protein
MIFKKLILIKFFIFQGIFENKKQIQGFTWHKLSIFVTRFFVNSVDGF